jgi:putative hydrolase of the HAD superfamily
MTVLSPGDADALLFDLGRVVFKIEFEKALACWAGHAGCHASDIAERFVRDDIYRHHEVGAISDEVYFDSLRRGLGIAISDAQFLEGWNAIFAGEMEGIAELLARAAQHLPLYVFSNTNRAHVEYFHRRLCGDAEAVPRALLLLQHRPSEAGCSRLRPCRRRDRHARLARGVLR